MPVENARLAYVWNAGQRVSYGREEPREIDGMLEGSQGSWAIEVKTGKIAAADLKRLGEFARPHPKFRPLVVCDDDARPIAEGAGFEAMPWSDFLLHGPPRPNRGG